MTNSSGLSAEGDEEVISLNEVLDMIMPIIEPSPIRRVIVFGSYAKGTALQNSDIDLVIDSAGELDGIEFFIYADKLASALPLKSDIYELIEIKKPSSLYNRIMEEGVVIFDRRNPQIRLNSAFHRRILLS